MNSLTKIVQSSSCFHLIAMRNIAAGTIIGYFNGNDQYSPPRCCIRASFDCCNVSIEWQERAQVDRSSIMITTANINEGEELVVSGRINVAFVAS